MHFNEVLQDNKGRAEMSCGRGGEGDFIALLFFYDGSFNISGY